MSQISSLTFLLERSQRLKLMVSFPFRDIDIPNLKIEKKIVE